MHHFKSIIIGLFLAMAIPAASALAEPLIFLNDVDITGVSNQDFDNVKVHFDASGNIHLIAPQYHIVDTSAEGQATRGKVVDGPKIETLPDDSAPTYLIASFNKPGLFGYNIDVYLNGAFVQKITQGSPQQHVDLTSHLKKGLNRIEYRLILAADSGTSIRAQAELHLSKMSGLQADSIELIGEYSKVIIKGSDGAKSYAAEFIVP